MDFDFIPIELIQSSKYKVRPVDEETVKDLMVSIRAKGLLQPIMVRKTSVGYNVVFGEHRLEAVKRLGIIQIPSYIRELSEDDELELKITENIHRNVFVNPVVEGEFFYRLMRKRYQTVNQLSEAIGKSSGYIGDRIRVYLQLDKRLESLVASRQITVGNAVALSRYPAAEQMKLAEKIRQVKKQGLGGGGQVTVKTYVRCVCPVCGSQHSCSREKQLEVEAKVE